MTVFQQIYLKLSKGRFTQRFKPVGPLKRANYLISPAATIQEFLKILPLLAGLHKIGRIFLIVPKSFEHILTIFKPNFFNVIYFKKKPLVLTKEFKLLKAHLSQAKFATLIELNIPANLSLAYLVTTDKRISFYDKRNFPYYNILLRGNVEVLYDFFQLEKEDPRPLVKFRAADLRKLEKKLSPRRPWLFVNSEDEIPWEGTKIRFGKDLLSPVEIYQALYLCDAYYGRDDELCELAKIFSKKIVTR